MDRQIILNKCYAKFCKNIKNIKNIELGFKFLDKLYAELKEIEYSSFEKDRTDIINLKIYNYKLQNYFEVKVSAELFQENLQFLYRKFLQEEYFSQFSWHNSFSYVLKEILEKLLNFNSIEATNVIIRLLSNCFVLFSTGKNEYDYNEIIDYFKLSLTKIDISELDADLIINRLMSGLVDSNLIIIKSYFFNKKKIFGLSDPYMDIVFNLNSIHMVSIYNKSNLLTEYDSAENLLGFISFLESYDSIWNKRDEVKKLTRFFSTNYSNLMDILSSYYILNLDNNMISNLPIHLKNVILSFHYNKILLNELCLQFIIISCFDSFFLQKNTNNILTTYTEIKEK